MATRTREVLKRFGADPDAVSVDDAAARVSASVVRERIVSALDRLVAAREVDRRACPAQAGGCRPVPGRGPGCRSSPGTLPRVTELVGQAGRIRATARVRRLSGRERGDPGGAAAAVVTGGGDPTTSGPEPTDDTRRDIPDRREGRGGREVALVSSGRGRRPGKRSRT